MCRKKLDKIEELTSKIHDNNVKTVEFSNKNDPLTFLTKIRDGKMTIERAKELQEDLNNNIKKIQKGIKTQEQNKTLANLNMLFIGSNEAISFIDGYGSIILKAKKMTAEEETEQGRTGLKILTPKQMLQRLPIPLAQVKAGNNSERLLNEISQIVHSL